MIKSRSLFFFFFLSFFLFATYISGDSFSYFFEMVMLIRLLGSLAPNRALVGRYTLKSDQRGVSMPSVW